MAKKPAGLGKGLGDLLEDNAPQIANGRRPKVIVRTEEKKTINTPSLFPDTKPKNKSLKANYR
jgi:hypothetical protein